jgi:two-component system, OmpR family, phosphate regulon sensor histidine kinase PhoR
MVIANDNQPTIEGLELLAEVSQLLTEVELDNVLNRVISLSAQAVGADKVSLFLHQDEQLDWAHIFTPRNLQGDEFVNVVNRVLNDGFAGWVFRNRRGDIILDTENDDRWIRFANDPIQVRSALCVPFMSDEGQVVAVVTLVHHEPNHFSAYHLRLLTIIANQATIAIRNAQLVNDLTQQRRQLQTILQSIRDGLIVLRGNGEIVLVNETALRLLNKDTQQTAIGTNLFDYADEDVVFDPLLEIIQQGNNGTEQWSLETFSQRLRIDFQVTMSLWKEPMMGVLGYVVVLHDITTMKDLSRFKDEMLRVASHDLRSPLALITGYTDMIGLDTPEDNTAVHTYVDIIKRSTERMGGLIDDLLRVERVRSNPLELQEKVDPETLVKQVVVNMRLSAEAKGQTFESKIQLKNVPTLMADTVLLRQAMENLVSNAIKYTPKGGKITIRATFDPERFHFSVQDTGIGIDPEHQKLVFESFYRVPSLAQQEKGSGLGLSLVRNVVLRHDGDVWLESEINKGSVFGFWLPFPKLN